MVDNYHQLIFAQTHARTSDPATSKAAAAAVTSKDTMLVVLEAAYARMWIVLHRGMTAEEAATQAGYPPQFGAWKRVSDLTRMGVIVPTGVTRPGLSGRAQRELRWVPPNERNTP
jgi:hypothetical protein